MCHVPESSVGYLWERYGEFIDGCLHDYCGIAFLSRGYLDPAFLTLVAVFAFLPQLLMAVCGGLVSLSVAWSPRSRDLTFMLVALIGLPLFNVAAWLSIWNALPPQPPWLPFGVTPGGLLLQLGLYNLCRRWNRPSVARSSGSGSWWSVRLVFWSYLHAMVFNHIQTARYLTYWPGGPIYARPIPDAPLWALWIDYSVLASYALGRPPHGTYIVAWTQNPADSLIYSAIVLMPQCLPAWRRANCTDCQANSAHELLRRVASADAQNGHGSCSQAWPISR